MILYFKYHRQFLAVVFDEEFARVRGLKVELYSLLLLGLTALTVVLLVSVVGIVLVIALLTIPGVQPLAASLLAGAGVLGIVLGVAAGPLIGNLIAGIQIAFTQPIKIGDVVVIEGEWGTIGEITAAYVVVYIWDRRRLIVPLSDIVNKPVENWTRRTTDLLATVKLHLDYRAPVEDIRAEYKRILDESGLWDGEAWSVLVTDNDDRAMVVRVLFSAPDLALTQVMIEVLTVVLLVIVLYRLPRVIRRSESYT